MSGKTANLYDELFAADSFEQKQQKKAEKAQKLKLATQTQNKAGKAAEQKGFAAPAGNKFVPVVDATRPEKRVFDRQSGTGRGKEIAKGGHSGWGKTVEKDEIHWHEAPVDADEEVIPAKAQPEKKKEEAPKVEETKTEETKTEEKKEEPKKQNPIAPPPRETLEQYEKRIRKQKNKLQLEKPKEVKEVESEVKLDGVEIMKPGKISRPAANQPSQQKKKKPAQEEKKDEEKEMSTADFFEGVFIPRPRRGGRGGGPFPPRGGSRAGEGRGEGGRGGPRPPRPEGERRGPPPSHGAPGAPAPRGPRMMNEMGPVQVVDRYVPGEKKSEGAAATSAATAPSSSAAPATTTTSYSTPTGAHPRSGPSYHSGPRGPRESRPYGQAPAPTLPPPASSFPSLGKK